MVTMATRVQMCAGAVWVVRRVTNYLVYVLTVVLRAGAVSCVQRVGYLM